MQKSYMLDCCPFDMYSQVLTGTHRNSQELTGTHRDSHVLTCTHRDSHVLTCTHMDSHVLTWTHRDSQGLTGTKAQLVHVTSLGQGLWRLDTKLTVALY